VIDASNPGRAQSWGWTDMNNHALAFEELMRQYYDRETSSFPRSFVPPGHAYYYGDDGRGSEASTGALLHTYGVKYANGDTGVATQLGEGGIDQRWMHQFKEGRRWTSGENEALNTDRQERVVRCTHRRTPVSARAVMRDGSDGVKEPGQKVKSGDSSLGSE